MNKENVQLIIDFMGYKKGQYNHGKNGNTDIYFKVEGKDAYKTFQELWEYIARPSFVLVIIEFLLRLNCELKINSFCDASIKLPVYMNAKPEIIKRQYQDDSVHKTMLNLFITFIKYYNEKNFTNSL